MILFSFDYPPNDGGIARLCANIAIALAKEIVPVTVLTQECDRTVQVDTIVNTRRVVRKRPLREWKAYSGLRLLPKKGLCISGIWYPEGLIALLARRGPHVVLAHGAELMPPSQRWRRFIWQHLQRFVLSTADMVVANSRYTEDLVRAVAPIAKVYCVPLAVDHSFFSKQNRQEARENWNISPEKRVILTVARVNAYKGYETVFHALASITSKSRQQFVYLIAGKGPDVEMLREKARELGVDNIIRWLGFVPEEDLPSLYSTADLFVLLTREIKTQQAVEGFGLVYLEAQACGTPVVGTNTGGIPDAISHGEGGWLIDQDDAEALTALLRDLVNNPDAFSEMGRIARERVEREFTWAHYIQRLRRAIREGGIELD